MGITLMAAIVFSSLHVYEGTACGPADCDAAGRPSDSTVSSTPRRQRRWSSALRQAWPETWVIVRGDSHFAYLEVDAMDRSATTYWRRHWPDEQRRISTTGPRGRR